MSRLVAWIIMGGAAILVFSLAFTPYEQRTDTWQSTDSGGLTQVTVTCPAPFRVLATGAGPPSEPASDVCVKSSRTLALEAGLVAVAAVLIAWKPVTRPRPTRLDPISKTIGASESDPD